MGRITGRMKRILALIMAVTMVICSSGITYAAQSIGAAGSLLPDGSSIQQAQERESAEGISQDEPDYDSGIQEKENLSEPESGADEDNNIPEDGAVLEDGKGKEGDGSDEEELITPQAAEPELTEAVNGGSTLVNFRADTGCYHISYTVTVGGEDKTDTLTGNSFTYPNDAESVRIAISEKDHEQNGVKGICIIDHGMKEHVRAENGSVEVSFAPGNPEGTLDYFGIGIDIIIDEPGFPLDNEFAILGDNRKFLSTSAAALSDGVYPYEADDELTFSIADDYVDDVFSVVAVFNGGENDTETVYTKDGGQNPRSISYYPQNPSGFRLRVYCDENLYYVDNLTPGAGQIGIEMENSIGEGEEGEDIAVPSASFSKDGLVVKSAAVPYRAVYILNASAEGTAAVFSFRLAEGYTIQGMDVGPDPERNVFYKETLI